MDTIAIPKTEYKQLQRQASAYKKMAQNLHESLLRDSAGAVVADFRETGLYEEDFLSDLEDGLRKSSYAKKK